jgi:hypothetical protein
MELKFKYISVLAQAQKMSGIAGIDQWRMGVEQSVQINPDCIDIINYDGINAEKAEMLGVPAKGVNDDNTIAAKRKQRADAQKKAENLAASQQMAAAAKDTGSAIKDAGATPVGQGGTALDALLNAVPK